ncbi:MAG TPA: hypothetical protein VK186_11510 [Candidatus Deferrimicrobium sp.]|nr:hypothetical protein [Candidatus Deferrimicrobium sp.]
MIKDTLNKLTSLKRLGFFVIALTVLMIGSSYSYGVVTLPNQPVCKTLIAGQTIDVGNVCLEVIEDNLIVKYTTTGGWELTEAHFWIGKNMSDMPQTKQGNPKIGNFPYNSGELAPGTTEYIFTVPLSSLGSELCSGTTQQETYFAAAHAAVQKFDNSSGGYQTETGWASGDPIVPKGSWAMYFTITFACSPDVPKEPECETAFAFGDKKLWDIIDPVTGDPITNRWGWQITVNAGIPLTRMIYAGAAQNDTTKGTYVGDLLVVYDGSLLTVNFIMKSPFVMQETHLYAGTVETDTAAPGLFGNFHDLENATSDSYQLQIKQINGNPIYIVAHAVVCELTN